MSQAGGVYWDGFYITVPRTSACPVENEGHVRSFYQSDGILEIPL